MLEENQFLQEAIEMKALCRRYHVPFVINDNVDIALQMNADGVHVGQSDMEADDVRAKIGPDKIIGVSAQTVEQAILAEQRGADYLGVGAVFSTGTKLPSSPPARVDKHPGAFPAVKKLVKNERWGKALLNEA